MTNKFPIGSQWRTRAGHRAVVVEHFENGDILVYQAFDGRLCNRDIDGMGGDGDLLTPWQEPRKGTFWVNVYEDGKIDSFLDKNTADHLSVTRIACVSVDWTEGEGL